MTAKDWNEQVVSGCHRSYNGIPMLTDRQRAERDAMLYRERLATLLAFADQQQPGIGHRAQDVRDPTIKRYCLKCGQAVRLSVTGLTKRYCARCR